MRNSSKVIVNNKERLINTKELYDLSRRYLPNGMSVEDKNKFIDEVIFRISDLEFNEINTNGQTIEEYYFAACLTYAKENSFFKFFDEQDCSKIFEYCGIEL